MCVYIGNVGKGIESIYIYRYAFDLLPGKSYMGSLIVSSKKKEGYGFHSGLPPFPCVTRYLNIWRRAVDQVYCSAFILLMRFHHFRYYAGGCIRSSKYCSEEFIYALAL